MKAYILALWIGSLLFIAGSCTQQTDGDLNDQQLDELVKRSYPYVAMFNVNNKGAIQYGGWNVIDVDDEPKDHTLQLIARPNNDTYYITCMMNLRKDAILLDMPAFDSKYGSLMITGYDHYVNIPLSTRQGDFQEAEKLLIYSARTEGYEKGEQVEGVDRYFEATGDFVSVVFQVMPHISEPGRYQRITAEEIAKADRLAASTGLFQPKGEMGLDLMLFQSVFGPIGQPAQEAVYPAISTTDGEPMNAQHDYVIRMSKEDMPPADAFWSFTLYDTENGFFLPNDRKKYSVGENAGMQLDKQGGMATYVAAEKPEGVPEENWLPLKRGDYNIDLVLRLYVPDLEEYREWEAPRAEKI